MVFPDRNMCFSDPFGLKRNALAVVRKSGRALPHSKTWPSSQAYYRRLRFGLRCPAAFDAGKFRLTVRTLGFPTHLFCVLSILLSIFFLTGCVDITGRSAAHLEPIQS